MGMGCCDSAAFGYIRMGAVGVTFGFRMEIKDLIKSLAQRVSVQNLYQRSPYEVVVHPVNSYFTVHN